MHRVIATALRPPTDWRRPLGRPQATWLKTIDEDVQPLNFGVHTAWKKARDRDTVLGIKSSVGYGNALLGIRHQEKEVFNSKQITTLPYTFNNIPAW